MQEINGMGDLHQALDRIVFFLAKSDPASLHVNRTHSKRTKIIYKLNCSLFITNLLNEKSDLVEIDKEKLSNERLMKQSEAKKL